MTLMQCSFQTRRAIPGAGLSLRADELTVQIKIKMFNHQSKIRGENKGKGSGASRWKDHASWVVFICPPDPIPTHISHSLRWCDYDYLIWHLSKGQQKEGIWDQKHTSLSKGHRASTPGHSCSLPNNPLSSDKVCLQLAEHVWGQKGIISILGVTMGWLISGDISPSANESNRPSLPVSNSCWLYHIFYSFSVSSACLSDW